MTRPTHDLEPCTPLARVVGRLFLRVAAWEGVGTIPPGRKFVVVAAPHTSNWDLPIALAYAWSRGLRLRVLVKHTVFWGPFDRFFRALGGIPVDRRAPGGLVASLVEEIRRTERITLLVSPTGTRARTDHWKSGFYHIARAADLPVVCCACDFSTRKVGILATFRLTGDVRADMDRFRAVFRPSMARFPELVSPIRIREEDEA